MLSKFFSNYVNNAPIISQDQLIALVSLAQKGDSKALALVLHSQSPLAAKMTYKFGDKSDDLFQQCMEYATNAIAKYDSLGGASVTTFVKNAYRNAITDYMRDMDAIVRIPANVREIGLRARKLADKGKREVLTTEEIKALETLEQKFVLMSAPLGGDGSDTIESTLASADDGLFEQAENRIVMTALNEFDPQAVAECIEYLSAPSLEVLATSKGSNRYSLKKEFDLNVESLAKFAKRVVA
jgi:DNA-directed RNA polymerase specialized sigma subunit